MKDKGTNTPQQQKFVNDRKNFTDQQIKLSQLYYLSVISDKVERTRSNTSTIVWIVVIGIIFSVLGTLGTMF